jgi:hypothetical protein
MVVWYRKSKARVSPADAAYFDDLRASGRHPAADFGDLPEEAQSVIAAMEVQHLDLARERYFSSGALWFLIGMSSSTRLVGTTSRASSSWPSASSASYRVNASTCQT